MIKSIETSKADSLQFIFQELQKMTEPDYDAAGQLGNAYACYALGRLHTQKGELELALKNLRKARKFGFNVGYSTFQYDSYLGSLHNLPEFQELLEHIWPELKDQPILKEN